MGEVEGNAALGGFFLDVEGEIAAEEDARDIAFLGFEDDQIRAGLGEGEGELGFAGGEFLVGAELDLSLVGGSDPCEVDARDGAEVFFEQVELHEIDLVDEECGIGDILVFDVDLSGFLWGKGGDFGDVEFFLCEIAMLFIGIGEAFFDLGVPVEGLGILLLCVVDLGDEIASEEAILAFLEGALGVGVAFCADALEEFEGGCVLFLEVMGVSLEVVESGELSAFGVAFGGILEGEDGILIAGLFDEEVGVCVGSEIDGRVFGEHPEVAGKEACGFLKALLCGVVGLFFVLLCALIEGLCEGVEGFLDGA